MQYFGWCLPDSKAHGAIMGPRWVLSAPDGPHVGPMNLAIRVHSLQARHTCNRNSPSKLSLYIIFTDGYSTPRVMVYFCYKLDNGSESVMRSRHLIHNTNLLWCNHRDRIYNLTKTLSGTYIRVVEWPSDIKWAVYYIVPGQPASWCKPNRLSSRSMSLIYESLRKPRRW